MSPPLVIDKKMSASYTAPEKVFDEAYFKGEPRPHWKKFWSQLDQLGREELHQRSRQADEILDENGVTYGATGEDSTTARPWKLDLIPMILDESTWKVIEAGIDQRARLFNLLISDLYGEQRTIKEGLLHPEAVFAHPGYLRATIGMHQQERSLIFYAAELARSPDGRIWVMADRADSPAGVGFALENRITANRSLPVLSRSLQVRKLSPFFAQFNETLRSLSPRKVEHPRIALLSAGPSNPHYFEDVYLARYLGYDLTQGSDLAVRDDQVFIKTLAGLVPVDVLMLRGNECGIDSVEFGGRSSHSVAGLLHAIRQGNVAAVNIPGSGIIEAPVFQAQLPGVCQFLLGEELKLPSIATWWCQNSEDRKYVFDNLQNLVVKPAFSASGSEEVIGADLSASEIDKLKKRIIDKPYHFIAQELIARSAVPMVGPGGDLQPGHVAFRVFAVSAEQEYSVMPGGLVRASDSSGPMELSIAGGETSKDLWVLASEPDEARSLLPVEHTGISLKRSSAMFPSRVADDLFWLGKSLEKSDQLARMMRFLVTRIELTGDSDSSATSSLARVLADIGAIKSTVELTDLSANISKLSELTASILPEADQSRGLIASISEILRLGSLVRDWISPETWQQFNRAGSKFLSSLNASKDLAHLADAFDDLILTLASAMGLIDNGMIRGPAWRFLDIGRRIERARTTSSLVRSIVKNGQYQDVATLKMLIEVSDCRMTYRSRYLDDVQQNAVVDLCMTDATNPRSVISQLEVISNHVDALPNSSSEALHCEEKRLAMTALHHVSLLTSEELGRKHSVALESVTVFVEQSMKELAALLERKYLLHSGEPRQFAEIPGVIA